MKHAKTKRRAKCAAAHEWPGERRPYATHETVLGPFCGKCVRFYRADLASVAADTGWATPTGIIRKLRA